MNVTGGSTDVTTYFVMRLAADGTEATGLTITNMDLQYTRSGSAPAAKVDATALAATNSAHGDNQAIEIDATDQPGLYRVDWPDAAFAAGVREVILSVKCATCFTEHLRVQIDTPVNVTSISADQQSATDLKDFADSGYDPSTNKVQGVVLTDTVTTLTNLPAITAGWLTATGIAGDAITAAKLAADVTTELQSGLATSAALSSLDGKVDTIDTNVDSILADTGTDGVVVAAASKTGYRLSSTGVDDILDEVVEGSHTFRQLLRGFAAALLAKASGLETTNAIYRDVDDSKNRIDATVDADGNRTAVTLDLT